MKTYDYLENVKEDVRDYIEENKIVVTSSNREEVEQELNDTLFVNDSVTGNASGSHDVSNNGCEKIGGCIINYRKILKRYVFKSHDRWQECYSINKTSIRKNYSGVTEIVELKSK